MLPYFIGSIGWIICAIHYTSEYFMYGSDFPEHIAQEDPFLSASAIAMIPLFMLVGYLLQIEKRTEDKLGESEYSTQMKRAKDGVIIFPEQAFNFFKREKEFSENLIETASAVIVTVDLEGNTSLCNTKAEEVTGYSKEEIIGENWLDLVYPDATYRKELLEVLKGCLEGVQVKAYETVITREDGRERTLSWDTTLLKDAGGELSGVLGIAQDITEKKQLEQELKESMDYLKSLIQESPAAILSTDSKGNVVVINKSAEKLLGYKYDELVGKPLSKVVPGWMDLEIAAKKDFLLDFVKKDGTEIPISVSTSLQLFKGERRGLIVTLKDLSELQGLLITPVSEVGVETEIEYQLEQGFIYIVEEEKPEKSFDAFQDSVKHGSQGLFISRQNPAWIKEKYQLEKTPNIWLTRTKIPEKNCISPDELAKLYKTIENFIRQADDGVIFFEGLEYLVAQNGFQPVLKFIQSLNDEIMVHPSRLIVAIDPLTMNTKELHIFKRDMKTIP